MSSTRHIRRFIALIDGDETSIEIRYNDAGDVSYTIGEREGEAGFTVAQNGSAVLMSRETRQLALRVASDGDHMEIMGRDASLSCTILPESRFLVSKMQGGLGAGTGTILSNMPGRVVKVMVTEGERVERGQGVLILEAMKMENEIKAPRDGVVSSVHIEEGESVESGTTLMEITDD